MRGFFRKVWKNAPHILAAIVFIAAFLFDSYRFVHEIQFFVVSRPATAWVYESKYVNFDFCEEGPMGQEDCFGADDFYVKYDYTVAGIAYVGEGRIYRLKAPDQIRVAESTPDQERAIEPKLELEMEYLTLNPATGRLILERKYDWSSLSDILVFFFSFAIGLVQPLVIAAVVYIMWQTSRGNTPLLVQARERRNYVHDEDEVDDAIEPDDDFGDMSDISPIVDSPDSVLSVSEDRPIENENVIDAEYVDVEEDK